MAFRPRNTAGKPGEGVESPYFVTWSLNDVLAAMAPAVSAAPRAASVVEDDLDRILALPLREPIDCRLDPATRRLPPKVEALVRLMTDRLGRGSRVSCACRPRVVRALRGQMVEVVRVLPNDLPPEPPRLISVASFVADNQSSAEEIARAEEVSRLRGGEVVRFAAADGEEGHFCIDTLNAAQAWALWEIPREGGGLGFLSVGSGKSALFILMPVALGAECDLAVLLIEPNQRRHYVSQYLRVREHFRVPSVVFDDGGVFIVPGAPLLHFLPYSKLGNPKYPRALDDLAPNVILADEAHRLTGTASSTGRARVRRYVARRIAEREDRLAKGLPVHRRAVYLVPASGTLEDKSVEDTAAVAAHALGTGSPLPLDAAEASKWSQVMDPVRAPDRKSTTARRLQETFAGHVFEETLLSAMVASGPEEAIREGYQRRRRWTPGVISAAAEGATASIRFSLRAAPRMPACVQAALRTVREEGVRPDGEVIVGDGENNVEAMVKIVAKQVAIGMYYYWAYPRVPCTCGGNDPRCEGCLRIEEWFQRRKRYGKELRSRLVQPLPHLDSPKLCKNAAIRAAADASPPVGLEVYCVQCRQAWPCGRTTHLPAWRSSHWRSWGEIENKVPHEQRVRWIGHDLPEAGDSGTHPGYYLARDTVAYAKDNIGVVWYQTVAYGHKVAEIAGLPCHGGGPDSEAAIRAETGKRSVVASLKSWGKGLDGLQTKFWKMLLPEMPSSNRIVEQVLGRFVRRGQRSDTVFTEYYAHVQEFREALRRVKARAEFNQSMTGQPALVLAADFDEE